MQMGKIVYIYHWDRIRAQIEMAQTALGGKVTDDRQTNRQTGRESRE